MEQHVEQGLVAYQALLTDRTELDELINLVATVSVDHLSQTQKKAFYINSYNLLVIKGIVNKYPVESPLKIEGFFDKVEYRVAGEVMTLNDLENHKLREGIQDARIHFVLVCAAHGCPRLVNFAYRPEHLAAQLEQQTRQALNDRNFIRVDKRQKQVLISEIFKWYEKDFIKESGSVRKFLNLYRTEKIPSGFRLEYYPYDWSLNEQKS
ncbi:DUF547 domain-containing protein [Rapidithrix thailandica]|uniref:DUF547 domain-containing protein n=1 Tax=Rapidithrix thailandica TaxID=413964 RepID=A0AAW9S0D4_9BACT